MRCRGCPACAQGAWPAASLASTPITGPDKFTRRYQAELTDPERAAALAHLRELAHRKKVLTLLTTTKDIDTSEAATLAKLVLS